MSGEVKAFIIRDWNNGQLDGLEIERSQPHFVHPGHVKGCGIVLGHVHVNLHSKPRSGTMGPNPLDGRVCSGKCNIKVEERWEKKGGKVKIRSFSVITDKPSGAST